MSYVTVRSATGDDRVVLWERDPRHPDGEVFVAGDTPVQAGLTQAVTNRIRDGLLDVVETGQAQAESEAGPEVGPTSPLPALADVVGEKNEALLNGIRIFSVEELADADPDLLDGIKGVGRITADDWIAKALAILNDKEKP